MAVEIRYLAIISPLKNTRLQASDSLGKITSKSGGSPPPNPEDDPKAPRFELWPAERSFSEVLMDKTMDTVGVSQSYSRLNTPWVICEHGVHVPARRHHGHLKF